METKTNWGNVSSVLTLKPFEKLDLILCERAVEKIVVEFSTN
uniref:Uncharacterized protein n=1 Tax=Anguilla anguilla TaxID=7936 RepID=A0A0E9RS46_ANGAN